MTSYDYILDEDDEDKITYIFASNQSYYTATFDPHQYADRVDLYPKLLTEGIGFTFFSFPFNKTIKNKPDERVRTTISNILAEFISEHGEGMVILYHCDHTDGKQGSRSRKFNCWDIQYNKGGNIYRRELSLEKGDKTYYIGYITMNSNNLEDINNEFDRFAHDLASDEKPSVD